MEEIYKSSGKIYNDEKAIISLTSWKARINTVSKTLFSLIQQCPGFHIVLCLSEEEFPQKEAELPDDLMLFVNSDLIEILWVYKNYKVYKKWIFTANKYKDVPIISADDDCIYTCNYALDLYNKWFSNKSLNAIRYEYGIFEQMQGPTSLYKLNDFDSEFIISHITDKMIKKSDDDRDLYAIFKKLKYKFGYVYKGIKKPYVFHDTIKPLHPDSIFKNMPCFKSCFRR